MKIVRIKHTPDTHVSNNGTMHMSPSEWRFEGHNAEVMEMTDYKGMVREFHEKYGHYTNESGKPAIPDDDVINLRYKLIEEEMRETLHALAEMMNSPNYELEHLTELADGIADSIVVLMGTVLAFGIPIDIVFEEVHRSNMSKSLEKNEYGKTIKGPHWSPPNIKAILVRWREQKNMVEPRTGAGSLD